MKHQQAITRLGKYHPQLSLLSSPEEELEEVMRVFDLKDGEQLTLKGFGSYDYLYILKGSASLRTGDGEPVPLQAGSQEHQRFLIKPDCEQLQIDAAERILLL